MRIDNTQSALASTEAWLLALNAQHTAEQREWEMPRSMTARIADKDAMIANLQQLMVGLIDPEAPVENDTDGV